MTIDGWTLVLQAVNVLVLIWVLGRFFWRPLSSMIAKRRATIQQALADAQAAQASAAQAAADIAHTRAGFAQERAAMLDAARQDASHERAALLLQAQAEAAATVQAAQVQIEQDHAAYQEALNVRAGQLAVDIAHRLLASLDADALHAAFLARLLGQLHMLPEPTRKLAADGTTLDVVSAQPLGETLQAQGRMAIQAALRADVPLHFSVDATLIAGLELRGSHLAVSNSWRADLARVQQELGHGQHD